MTRKILAIAVAATLTMLSCDSDSTKAQKQKAQKHVLRATQKISYEVKEFTIEKNNALVDLFINIGLDKTKAHQCALKFSSVIDPRSLRPGQKYKVTFLGDSPRKLELELNKAKKASINIETMQAQLIEKKTETTAKFATFKITSSLWESAISAGFDPALVDSLADIFAWDIDFNVELRSGDEFSMIYEVTSLQSGEAVSYGRILAAHGNVSGKERWAIWYRCGKNEGYYDLEGKSLKKAFLRSPLRFTRISSKFSHARYHPILRIVRPHLGVDYAAPTGTPVWSVADGTVTYAGWKGGYGKFVEIRHVSGYSTTYGHFSGFAHGVKKGARVRQGQTIGYVGATGQATGPHLDFRMKKNGKFVNPLSQPNVKMPPLAAECSSDFLSRSVELAALLTSEDKDALSLWYIVREKGEASEGG